MEKAIKKILKNFVFEDGELPEFRITSNESPETGKTDYRVDLFLPKDHKVMSSLKGNIEIMERMKTAFVVLGLSGVKGNRFIDNFGDMLMTTEGYLMTNR
jgi:hypothetical protein